MSKFRPGDYVRIDFLHVSDSDPVRDNGEDLYINKIVQIARTDDFTWHVHPWNIGVRNLEKDCFAYFKDDEVTLICRNDNLDVLDVYEEGYKKGGEDAWALARFIVFVAGRPTESGGKVRKAFAGCKCVKDIFAKHSYEGARKKLDDYDRDETIHAKKALCEMAEKIGIDHLRELVDEIIRGGKCSE